MGVTPRSLAVKALWHCGNSLQGVREPVEDEACSPSSAEAPVSLVTGKRIEATIGPGLEKGRS